MKFPAKIQSAACRSWLTPNISLAHSFSKKGSWWKSNYSIPRPVEAPSFLSVLFQSEVQGVMPTSAFLGDSLCQYSNSGSSSREFLSPFLSQLVKHFSFLCENDFALAHEMIFFICNQLDSNNYAVVPFADTGGMTEWGGRNEDVRYHHAQLAKDLKYLLQLIQRSKMFHGSNSQSLSHVRLLSYCLSYADGCLNSARGKTGGDAIFHSEETNNPICRAVRRELAEKCTCPIPVNVLLTLFRVAAPSICMQLVLHRRQTRTISVQNEWDVVEKETNPQLVLIPEQQEAFFGCIRALLTNPHFSSNFHEMHLVLLSIISDLKCVTNPVSDSIIPALTRLSRVYSSEHRSEELLEVHDYFHRYIDWLKPYFPFRYMAWVCGVQLDKLKREQLTTVVHEGEGDTTVDPKNSTVPELAEVENVISILRAEDEERQGQNFTHEDPNEKHWHRFLSVFEESLQLFAKEEELRHFLTIGKGVATKLKHFQRLERLIVVYQNVMQHGHGALLDQDDILLLMQWVGKLDAQALSKEGAVQSVISDVISILNTCVSKPFFLMDCILKLLAHLHQRMKTLQLDTNEIHENKEKAQKFVAEAAKWVFLQLKEMLNKFGRGFEVEKNGPLRAVLEELGAISPALFWWKCGCGSRNVDITDRCTACLRNEGRGCWQCTHCHKVHYIVDEACVCGVPHPAFKERKARNVELCTKCSSLIPADGSVHHCPSANIAVKGVRICQACGASTSSSSPICVRCGKPHPRYDNVPLQLWLCKACSHYTFSLWNTCSMCRERKQATSLVFPCQQWSCGCGSLNPNTRTACSKCSKEQGSPSFLCMECKRLSNCQRVNQVVFDGYYLKITSCNSCEADHPRDVDIVQNFLRCVCVHCGYKSVASSWLSSSLKKPGDEEEKICPGCLQVSLVDASFTAVQWRCSCGFSNRSITCTNCGKVKPSLQSSVYLWKCNRLHNIKGAGRKKSTSSSNNVNKILCEHWNPSWMKSCQACRQHRIRDEDHEIRCRYFPWICPTCHAEHSAHVILVCPKCSDGVHVPPPCPRCGESHLTFRCPAPEIVKEAERIIALSET